MSTKDTYQIEKWGAELNSRAIMFHNAIGERMGLSATEHKAADIIRRFGPMTAGELAEQTGLTTGAVTGLVDRLEKEGFVYREHDKRDRRRVIIMPVEHGKNDEVKKLFVPVRAEFSKLLEKYNPREVEIIADFATKAAEVFKQATNQVRQDRLVRHDQ